MGFGKALREILRFEAIWKIVCLCLVNPLLREGYQTQVAVPRCSSASPQRQIPARTPGVPPCSRTRCPPGAEAKFLIYGEAFRKDLLYWLLMAVLTTAGMGCLIWVLVSGTERAGLPVSAAPARTAAPDGPPTVSDRRPRYRLVPRCSSASPQSVPAPFSRGGRAYIL